MISASVCEPVTSKVVPTMHGQMPPEAPYHAMYAVLELLKLVGLLVTGAACLRAERRPAPLA